MEKFKGRLVLPRDEWELTPHRPTSFGNQGLLIHNEKNQRPRRVKEALIYLCVLFGRGTKIKCLIHPPLSPTRNVRQYNSNTRTADRYHGQSRKAETRKRMEDHVSEALVM